MIATEYKRIRKNIGTQERVAQLLDVTPETICRREKGALPVLTEAALAIVQLHLIYSRSGRDG